jgi:uncharacterized protein (DUF58 family)
VRSSTTWAGGLAAARDRDARPGRLLSNAFLLQLERLSYISRRTRIGRVKGERKSPRTGSSVEFADYRPYEVGDDLRYVDWNVFGRLNRLYLKLFMDEEDLCVHLLLDGSGSMDVGGGGGAGSSLTKFGYGIRLAAALAFVGFANLERVGLAVFRDRVADGFSPTRGRRQFLEIQAFLGALVPQGVTRFNDAVRQYAMRARDPGVAIVISDFLDPAGYAAGLRALMERRFDVHVLHLIAPEELNPPFGGDLELVDVESGEAREVTVDADALRAYERSLTAFLAGLEGFCRANELNYVRAQTHLPLEDLLLRRLKGSLLQ